MRPSTFALLSVLLSALATGSARPGEPDAIVIHDLTPLRRLDLSRPRARLELWDQLHLVAALQGLANRERPRLYVRFIEPWDDFWLDWLRSSGHWLAGRPTEEVPELEPLLERFRDAWKGVVLYDLEPAALSLAASTAAGAEDLLPIRRDERTGSLYDRLVRRGPRLPVRLDLGALALASAGPSPKAAVYRHARRRWLEGGRTDPAYLAHYIDAWWLRDPFGGNHENHSLTNHDYFIAHRAFFFDLSPWADEPPVDDPGQPLGTDRRELEAILRAASERTGQKTVIHVGGFVPWAWKYTSHRPEASRHPPVATEWKLAELLSSYDALIDADALGSCAMANASFYQHYPLRERYRQPPMPSEADLRRAGHLDEAGLVRPGAWIAFYVGDYDSAAWLYREFPRCWRAPGRGEVPLGWALDPILERRAPMALVWARETRTPLDIFTTGDCGVGYLNPGGLEPPRASGLPSGVALWESFSRPFLRRWDLRVAGFVIDGSSPAMGEAAWAAYARLTPGGLGGQKIPPRGVRGGLPFVRVTDLSGSPEEAAAQLAATIDPEQRSFFYVRTILRTATWHRDVARRLAALEPAARIVDPHVFFALLGRYEEHRDRYPKPRWSRDDVSWSPKHADGLRIVPYPDGPLARETVAGRLAVVSRAPARALYLYFSAHDGFSSDRVEGIECELEYLDAGFRRFAIQYNAPESAYRSSRWVRSEGSGRWRTARITLAGARLSNQQNGTTDLRVVNERGRLAISRLRLRHREASGDREIPSEVPPPSPERVK